METKYFKCENCNNTFEKGWSDKEAKAEMKKNKFDKYPEDEMAIVCDDCYKKLMKIFN
jgi:hypothetical protein